MRHTLCTLLTLFCVSSCAADPADGDAEAQAADQTAANAPKRDAAPGKVAYYGGRIIPNAKVYVVYWGRGDGLKPEVTQTKNGIGDFFTGILDSVYMDGLSAFNTDRPADAGPKRSSAGTKQHIGRGSYAGAFPLSPPASAASGEIADEQISATLESAITSGDLPSPDANTVYAIYFPVTAKIRMQRMTSCIEYRAYHFATPASQHGASYLVIPDCGDGYSVLTRVSAHELVEAVTDPLPARGGEVGAAQSWSRTDGTENCDFCTGDDRLVQTKLGKFAVQGWSDATTEQCIIGHASPTDFAISTSSDRAVLTAGSPKTVTFETSTIAGASQTLTLSVSAPSGVTATLDATTVTSGESVSVTLEVTSGARITDGQVVVTASSGSGNAKTFRSASRLVASQ
jgi:hypothetical protein